MCEGVVLILEQQLLFICLHGQRLGDYLGSTDASKPGANALPIGHHRFTANLQPRGNLFVRQPLGGQFNNLLLSWRAPGG